MAVQPSKLVVEIHDRAFEPLLKRYVKGSLVDIGCGVKPFRAMVAKYADEHVGVDHPGASHGFDHVDLVGSAYEIPVSDERFDAAICTAVLEHLEEPELALRECFRVLKPGGYAIYSVPFIWHLHEAPRDFFRYSEFGLRHLFKKTGFEVIELIPLAGFWTTFATQVAYQMSRADKSFVKRFHLLDPVAGMLRTFARRMEKADPSPEWTWMYIVVVRRPLAAV